MCVVWDQTTVNITNNTTSPLTLSTSNATTGKFDSKPTTTINPNGGTGSFVVNSTCGNASDGCAANASYSLTDGTVLTISAYTSYYYGIDDNSAYNAGFTGSKANHYQNIHNSQDRQSSNGGAGKRVTWTLSVDPK